MQQLDTPYQIHDLVWAKISNYPWWPGKIAQICQHKKSLFFKIRFFADPTYCYVHEHEIIPYQEFKKQLNSGFHIDSQLQKAINLANNVFQKKKQNIKKRIQQQQELIYVQQQANCSDSQIIEQQPQKAEQFQQSTIHIDFETENQNRKNNKLKKATQIKNLLAYYKLDKIPKLSKSSEIEFEEKQQQEASASECESQQQEKVQLFDLKNTQRRKIIKKRKNKKHHIVRKRKVLSLSNDQRKFQFMKRLCSLLISKGFESQTSRQITVKIIEKTVQIENIRKQKQEAVNTEKMYIKMISIVNEIDDSDNNENKLLQIFSPIDTFIYQYHHGNEKEEQEKTNLIYAQAESQEAIC